MEVARAFEDASAEHARKFFYDVFTTVETIGKELGA